MDKKELIKELEELYAASKKKALSHHGNVYEPHVKNCINILRLLAELYEYITPKVRSDFYENS